ncbi:MAG: acyl-CoA dehydrogenase family protein, partial [Gemmatimonadota bacterium]
FQLVREKLGRMATGLAAARLLVYRAAWERDRGAERTNVEAAMAKSFATETAQRVVDEAIQILGGRGVLADGVVDRLYRSVRALRIYEGTTEIQRLTVAAHLIDAAS